MRKLKPFNVLLSPQQIKDVKAAAKAAGVSAGSLIRAALDAYLAKK